MNRDYDGMDNFYGNENKNQFLYYLEDTSKKKSEFLPIVLWILISTLFWKTLAEESWIS
jgi:hypothetical protein